MFNKPFTVFVILLLLSVGASAETMYLTFLSRDAIQQGEISLALNKKSVPAKQLMMIDTANPTPEMLKYPAGRRNYFLVYDLIFNKPADVVAARKATEALLAKLDNDDLVAVLSMPRSGGLRLLSGLTADRSKTIIALNQLGLTKIQGFTQGPDGNLYAEKFEPKSQIPSLIPEAQFLQNLGQDVVDEKKKQEPASLFVTSFADLVYSLSAVNGRKNLILFSPGFDVKGAKIKVEEKGFADDYVDKVIAPPEYLGTPEEQRGEAEQMRRQELEQELSRKQAPSIQVEGIPEFVAGTFSTIHIYSPTGVEHEFYKTLTSLTGGMYLHHDADGATWADRVLSLDRKFYAIAFDSKTEKEFKNLHPLKIEAAGKQVIAPSTWVAPRPYVQFGPLERKFHISQAMYVDPPRPAGSHAFWSDFVYDQQTPKIPLFAQINGQELIKKDVADLTLEFYSFAANGDGIIYDYAVVPVRMDLKNKKLREKLGASGLRVWSLLVGQHGPANVRLILIQPELGETVTYSSKLDIAASDLTTSYPFFPSVNLNWMVWPNPDSPAPTHRGVAKAYPYRLGEKEFFFPELSPVLKKSESGQIVYFKIYNMLPESKNPPIKLQLVHPDGKVSEVENFGLLQKPRTLEHGGMELFWKLISLPSDLAPGPYKFKVNIKDTRNNREIVREIPMQLS